MQYIDQANFIRRYNERNREEFNNAFFKRENADIMNAVKKIAYSCEKDRYFTLKVLETREIYDYEEIYTMLRDHEERRKKKNIQENSYDYINIKDSDIMLLEIKYLVRHNGEERWEEPDTKKPITVKDPWEIVQVLVALPRFTRKYYFRLKGNFYTGIFQIVDGSTYNNSNVGIGTKKEDNVTFKTMFMPVRIYRSFRNMTDFHSKLTKCNTLYSSIIFNNRVNAMNYILANFGLYGAMDFLDIRCIRVMDQPIADPNWYSFQKHNLFVCYPMECEGDPMVQSLAATIYDSIGKETTVDNVFNIRYWMQVLGKCFKNDSVDKGLFVLDSIDGIYDIITRDSLHLPDDAKANIYQILRWIMREFTNLKNKDNVDVSIKRLRLADYIAHVYATKLSTGLHRVSDMGKKVTLRSVIRAIYTNPMYVINAIIGMSNLVDYRDLVNDNDALLALKYTYKGISGLGENGSSVQKLYRYVDPSHAGIVDLDASTESDPGMAGIICPMAQLYQNNSFSAYQEPNNWAERYKPLQDYFIHQVRPNAINPIISNGYMEPSYLKQKEQIIQESLDIDRVISPIYDINDPDSNTNKYSSIGLALKNMDSDNILQSSKGLFTIMDNDDNEEEYYE